jgi:hypothetical protein
MEPYSIPAAVAPEPSNEALIRKEIDPQMIDVVASKARYCTTGWSS